MKRTLFFASLLILTSCISIAKTIYGIKDPKIETKESIQKYANSIDMNSQNILLVKDKNAYKPMLQEFQRSIPEAVLFDSNGNRVTYKSNSQDCNAGLFATIPKLTPNTKLEQQSGKNLNDFTENLVNLNNNKVENLPKADFYLFLNWAKFMGKLNKDHVRIWEELAKNNKDVNIAVYKVNMDFLDTWDLKDKNFKMITK
ncbi:hypothetical protein SAMN05421789_103195 [Kaistella chaponensis]|uniref:Lipoprotein n=1 Tax=Kaistella chaponensis TaxID=713588 RepID=A0A1N7KGT7_9FLAO|nr:hypothetical protein [Kaistella chaponensis]SIS60808.1 hypothetical protein SAMN05421789_103195 [Kaistella chaponensis]